MEAIGCERHVNHGDQVSRRLRSPGNSIKRDDAPVNNREDYKLKRNGELTNATSSIFLITPMETIRPRDVK